MLYVCCAGVEALPGLCQASREVIEQCRAQLQPGSPSRLTSSQQRRLSQQGQEQSSRGISPSRADGAGTGNVSALAIMEIW